VDFQNHHRQRRTQKAARRLVTERRGMVVDLEERKKLLCLAP